MNMSYCWLLPFSSAKRRFAPIYHLLDQILLCTVCQRDTELTNFWIYLQSQSIKYMQETWFNLATSSKCIQRFKSLCESISLLLINSVRAKYISDVWPRKCHMTGDISSSVTDSNVMSVTYDSINLLPWNVFFFLSLANKTLAYLYCFSWLVCLCFSSLFVSSSLRFVTNVADTNKCISCSNTIVCIASNCVNSLCLEGICAAH